MRPQERAGRRPPALHPGDSRLRAEKVLVDLLGKFALCRCSRRDPLELRPRVVDSAGRRLVPAEQPGQQEPEAAAVEDVVGVPVHAAADHELGLDRAHGRFRDRVVRLQ